MKKLKYLLLGGIAVCSMPTLAQGEIKQDDGASIISILCAPMPFCREDNDGKS